MYCYKCGAELPHESVACYRCGTLTAANLSSAEPKSSNPVNIIVEKESRPFVSGAGILGVFLFVVVIVIAGVAYFHYQKKHEILGVSITDDGISVRSDGIPSSSTQSPSTPRSIDFPTSEEIPQTLPQQQTIATGEQCTVSKDDGSDVLLRRDCDRGDCMNDATLIAGTVPSGTAVDSTGGAVAGGRTYNWSSIQYNGGTYWVSSKQLHCTTTTTTVPPFDSAGKPLRAICINGDPSYWQGDAAFTCLVKGGVRTWIRK